jgi:hypothetical protein
MVPRSLVLGFVVLGSLGSGCGDEPVAYSAPVTLNLKAKSSDVVQGALDSEKSISSETGDPYGTFVKTARSRLGKSYPARVEVTSLSLFLGAHSTGVTTLDQVFTGPLEVLFVLDGSNNSYPAGHLAAPSGAGPEDVEVDFAFLQLAPSDQATFFAGEFKVQLRGPAAPGFAAGAAEADLQLVLQFEAYR